MKKIKITFNNLSDYAQYLKENPDTRISLNEYMNIPKGDIADLSGIRFDENHRLDLTGADLSGTILDGLEFDGKLVILKGADLRGASINHVKFTNHINLSQTKLGSITLDKKVFFSCQLKDADYDPMGSKTVMVSPTDKQLEGFMSSNLSLNEYLAEELQGKYPKNCKIIADLRGHIIDERFSNKNLSGSNLSNATITGNIKNLELRDCITCQTKFENCHLTNLDIRGTSLVEHTANIISGDQGFQAAIFRGKVIFEDPKASIDLKDASLLEDRRFIPLQNQAAFTVDGPVVFDPCYKKGSNSKEVPRLMKFSRSAVERYAKYCLETPKNEIKDFSSFMRTRMTTLPEHFVANLSGLDLTNIEGLNKGIFRDCNLSFSNLKGSNLSNATFEGCNLSGVKFPTELSDAVFNNCDLTYANLRHVNARGATFYKSRLMNIQAEGFILQGSNAHGCNFSGAYLSGLVAESLEADRSDWSYSYCKGANFDHAKLDRSNFSHANCTDASAKEANLNYCNFYQVILRRMNLTKAKMNYSRVSADIKQAKMIYTELSEAEIEGLYNMASTKGVDFKAALFSASQHKYILIQAEQEIQENEKAIYNKYTVAIIASAIAALIIIPIAITALAPALIAATITAVVTPIIQIAAVTVIGTMLIDKVIDKALGQNLGLNKFIANKLGAKKVVQRVNERLENLARKEKDVCEHITSELKNLSVAENEIQHESRKRYRDVPAEGPPSQGRKVPVKTSKVPRKAEDYKAKDKAKESYKKKGPKKRSDSHAEERQEERKVADKKKQEL
jgi:uncharacterized protein YjbI with pentapeptide repeats